MVKHVCSTLDHFNVPPKNYTKSITCPDGCKTYRMVVPEVGSNGSHLKKFKMDKDGRLMLKKIYSYAQVNELFSVSDFIKQKFMMFTN